MPAPPHWNRALLTIPLLTIAHNSVALTLATGTSAAQCPVVTFKLLASDGGASNNFGRSIGISGTTAIVGADLDDDNGTNSGSAYLFDITTGLQIAKLLPSDSAAGDRFGVSVGISGTTAIVGADLDDDNGGSSGSAYLFDTTTGLQIAKLLPSDGIFLDRFGGSVGVSGTTAIVGAMWDNDVNNEDSGSAYLFDITTGQQIAKLLPSDGAAEDLFGVSVGISGTTAIVGAWLDDDNGTDSGSVYLFDITTGLQTAKLLPSDGAAEDFFGYAIGISGTTAIVGAWRDDDNGLDSGSAYLFDITTGLQIAKLLPSDGAAEDFFGGAVGISGTTAMVSALGDDDNGSRSGSAYLFDITTGLQIAKLLPSDGAAADQFAESVGISGTAAIVGAAKDDDDGVNSGSAYAFNLTDCNANGIPDSLDISSAASLDCDLNRVPDECQIAADPGLDSNGNGVLDSCEASGFNSFCNGDGGDQLGCSNCPCSNNAAPGTLGGCLNSVSRSARLLASGDASVSLPAGSTSDLRFSLTGALPSSICLLKSADAQAPGNAVNPCFGLNSGIRALAFDGLRCILLNERRHGGRAADTCGEVGATTNPWGGEGGPPAGIAVAGAGFVSGQTRYFQVVYRDDPMLSCMRGLNTSQAVEVTFTP